MCRNLKNATQYALFYLFLDKNVILTHLKAYIRSLDEINCVQTQEDVLQNSRSKDKLLIIT